MDGWSFVTVLRGEKTKVRVTSNHPTVPIITQRARAVLSKSFDWAPDGLDFMNVEHSDCETLVERLLFDSGSLAFVVIPSSSLYFNYCLMGVIAFPLQVSRETSSRQYLVIENAGLIISPKSGSQLGYILTLQLTNGTVLAYTRDSNRHVVPCPIPKRHGEVTNLRIGLTTPLAKDLNNLPGGASEQTGYDWIVAVLDYLKRCSDSGQGLTPGTIEWTQETIKANVKSVIGKIKKSQKAEVDKLAPAVQHVVQHTTAGFGKE
ncbi:hypothetical protein F5876DRAFT_69285 [Lentinula aff. lateritia]|uniref:Uncharacterized protein n=1 Tax=Lentinula aff. lateritia TaxID=2804960 RepID=A0ACC1TNS9_9AGAR|nr:hypothetical protein F5876DRAFT_69285 [Lentinula aff. lateritia]